MKLLNKSIYALSLVGMMGLWSCSSEEALPGGQTTVKGQPVPLTITVNRGDTQTRTILEENAQAGLDSKWVTGDKVFVYNTNGVKVGDLTLQSVDPENPSVGIFSGEITAEDGTNEYAIWYYDTNNTRIEFTGNANFKGISIDLRSQKFASAEELSTMDVMGTRDIDEWGGLKVTIKDNKAAVAEDVTLESKLAMARFSLEGVGLPEGKQGTLNIYNADGWSDNEQAILTKNVYKAIYTTAAAGQTLAGPEGITVENAEVGKDVFVAFAPGACRLGFTFTTTEGDVYKYEYANSTTLVKGVYYNNGIDAEGKVLGAPLAFKHEDGRDDDKIFKVVYHRNMFNATPSNDDIVFEDSFPTTDAEHTFTLMTLAGAFPGNTLDENIYRMLAWADRYNASESDQKRNFGDKLTLSYDATTGAKEIVAHVYGYWETHYVLNVVLTSDVKVTGASLNYDGWETSKNFTCNIVDYDNGGNIERPGYTLKGWREVGTEEPVVSVEDNDWTLTQKKPSATIEPVWEEIPHTITTGGYGHGSFN